MNNMTLQVNNRDKQMTCILVLEDIDFESGLYKIDELVSNNIANQTIGQNNIEIIVLTLNDATHNPLFIEHFDKNYNFKSVRIFNTENKNVTRLDEMIPHVRTKYYCYKTIGLKMVNERLMTSPIQFLNNHFESCIDSIEHDSKLNNSMYALASTEYVNFDDFGVKEIPDLLFIRELGQVPVETIKLDELIFTKALKFSFSSAIVKDNYGTYKFLVGILLQKFQHENLQGSLCENVTIRQFIESDSISKPLRIIVEGNTIRAV